MRIGVVPRLNGQGGGLYQYSLTLLSALRANQTSDDQFVVFTHEKKHPAVLPLVRDGWTVRSVSGLNTPLIRQQVKRWAGTILGSQLQQNFLRSFRKRKNQLHGLSKSNFPDPDVVRSRKVQRRWLEHCGVELMIYPVPDSMAFESGIPYIMAIPDLQHRLQPEFPEVSQNGIWESREYVFRNGIRHATLLLADSEIGKEDILSHYGEYGVTEDKVRVIPYLPPPYLSQEILADERLRVANKYKLPEQYLFYPAQFWSHKNHAGIVQALALLKQDHALHVRAVFCGSNMGEAEEPTYQRVRKLTQHLGLQDQILFLGYIPDEDMSGLYANALALVMPTFFGPTNIPVVEAWAFGCPVLTSDIRGIREHAGDAAILVDPNSTEAMAEGIYAIWTDQDLRRSLASRGRKRLDSYTYEDYCGRLTVVLEEAKQRAHLSSSNTNRKFR